MKILNIMLSHDLGGIQQAFLDYSAALKLKKLDVINVTSINAKINSFLPEQGFLLPNLFSLDFVSIIRLKYIIYITKPDIIIVHGNRAINFVKFLNYSGLPVIGVAHNYNLKNLKKCDHIIALTKHMKNYLLQNDFLESKISILPNMIQIKKEFIAKTTYRKPVVIGVIARFVTKKGIDIFLQSLAILREQGYEFKALIGGDGEEENRLISLMNKLNLSTEVEFIGWIKDKDKFFRNIDIFCLPSLHEPFGIILLEAMESSIPIVATKSEGPQEILEDTKNGLLCEVGSSHDLAQKIIYLIDHPIQANEFAKNAYLTLQKNYATDVIAEKLANLLKGCVKKI